MDTTRFALGLLGLCWLLQAVASWSQYRRFHRQVADLRRSHGDGFLGIGESRSAWGARCVAVLVAGPDLRVRSLHLLSGLTVFARLREQPQVRGLAMHDVPGELARLSLPPRASAAVRAAIDRIDAVRATPPPAAQARPFAFPRAPSPNPSYR